jgi:hypothetical protein
MCKEERECDQSLRGPILSHLMRVLEPEDRARFHILTGMLPKPLAGPADKIISLLIRPGIAGATMTKI